MRRPRKKYPEQAGRLLEVIFSDMGGMAALRTGRIRAVWERIVGPQAARHISPVSLERGVLTAHASSQPWLAQASYFKPLVMERLGSMGVRDVRFKLGPVSSPPGRPRRPALVRRPMAPEDMAFIEQALLPISEPETREAMRRLMLKALSHRRPT